MDRLAGRHCEPCTSGTPPLTAEEIGPLHRQVPDWDVIDGQRLFKSYKFKNFIIALDFVNRIGSAAEEEGHHPDIRLSWGLVEITLFTHVIHGLSENDFILAARIDELYKK